jgi:hypothetical protein
MDARFEVWMEASGSDAGSTRSRISNLQRVESAYGDLDALYGEDGFASLLADLTYTTADARQGLPNRSRIAINGDVYNGLATLRSAVAKYLRFRNEVTRSLAGDDVDDAQVTVPVESLAAPGDRDLTFSMERDLQAALRRSIDQLEPGLTVIDGGGEHIVPSGRIDILSQDAEGARVVIELKAVRATRDAVAQVLAYMGDLAQEDVGAVRGVLVAPEFDARAVAAARVVPTLRLVRYGFSFTFTPQD